MSLLAAGLFVAGLAAPALAGPGSRPAQVAMVATMPAVFSLHAAPALLSGGSGNVQVENLGSGAVLVRGKILHLNDGRARVQVPLTLASNTCGLVVRAKVQRFSGAIRLDGAPGAQFLARPAALRNSGFLGMALPQGRTFFDVSHPLHVTLEVVEEVPEEFEVRLDLVELPR